MLRANFFFKFFKYKQNTNYEIMKYNSNENFSLQDQINTEIVEIDKIIAEHSKALVDAQIVKLRSTFSRSNNFIDQIGKNLYKTKLDDSINWHQKELRSLYLRRKELKINLEKSQGVFWLNRIKRFLRLILIGILISFSLIILLSGFMIVIYLLPLVLLIFLVSLIANKRY